MKRISSTTIALLICATFLIILPRGSTNGQTPRIGIVDFYGLRSISVQQAREALQIKEDDVAPDSRDEAERRLQALPNVQQARLNFVCCDAGKAILYVGISEKGAPTLQYRPAPLGTIRLPQNIVQAGEALSDAVTRAAEKGDVGEDDSQGHALFHSPEARALQERFVTFAEQHLKLLRAVLRASADAQDRALAAEIIAYAPNKRDVVNDLVYGMTDPDVGVRNNSMRALGVIAKFAQNARRQSIKVPMQPFVAMLNSIEWTDRNKAAAALFQLTEKRDAAVLSGLRRHALQSLVEMARWKSLPHAQSPFFILGRVGKLSEAEIWQAWNSGNRESLIQRVLKSIGTKRMLLRTSS
ncbi:MAG TPA: hypothetical protein VGW76_21050 [Pyrinomonadaceae bacterium]|nr:hypothetical protein [Pyrinomonadaceae bacterium]